MFVICWIVSGFGVMLCLFCLIALFDIWIWIASLFCCLLLFAYAFIAGCLLLLVGYAGDFACLLNVVFCWVRLEVSGLLCFMIFCCWLLVIV